MTRKALPLALALPLAAVPAAADLCSFSWQYDPAVPVDGFRLYLKSGDQYALLWAGASRQAAVDIPHGTKGDVVVRAFRGQVESADSVPWYIKLVGKPPRLK